MIIIAGRVVEIQPRYTAAEAPHLTHVLRHLWLAEATNRLERFNGTEEAHIFEEAKRLETIDILATIDVADSNLAAMIELEAIAIASEKHQQSASVLSEARRRVEAKLRASAALVSSHKEEFS